MNTRQTIYLLEGCVITFITILVIMAILYSPKEQKIYNKYYEYDVYNDVFTGKSITIPTDTIVELIKE
jgi:hypothetical protein